MARSYGGDKKPDDVLEAIVAVTGVLIMVIGMVWFMRGEVWVRSWTSPLYAISRAWLWVPGDAWAAFAEPLVLSLHATGRQFLSNPKEVISGSIMYMPFSGEDKTFVSKMVNVIGSGLYPLGLSLLLPLLLYMLVS